MLRKMFLFLYCQRTDYIPTMWAAMSNIDGSARLPVRNIEINHMQRAANCTSLLVKYVNFYTITTEVKCKIKISTLRRLG